MSNTSGFFLFLAFIYSGQLAAQTTDWQQLPGPIGGSVNTIAQSGNTWYAGTGNGVFQSEDEGLSWEHLDWIPQSESVAGLFISADEILVTALKIDLSGYSTDNWTALLYRSTDSGQSWVVTEIIKDLSAYDPLVIFRHRGQLFITSGYQLFLHSEDNGQTWEEVPGAGAQLQSVQHSDSLLLMENLSYEFFYSENSGETWIPLQLPTGGGSIVLGGGNTIFSFHQINSSYRSTNLGADWLNIGVLFHYTEIKSCKKLPDNTLVAMVEYQDNDEMLFTSENNGLTWKKLTGSPYSQPIDVVGSSSALGVATASGFYKNYQGGNFLNPSAKGLLASDITSLAATGNQMLAGAEEGLWRTFDGGNNWMPSYPLGQLRSAVDLQINGDTISTLAARNFFFSTDNGESWTAPYNLGGNSGSPFSIFNLYQMAIEGETVLVGGYGFYTSFNFGESWSEFPGFSQTSGVLAAKGRYFAVEDWDGIKRSLDGGVTWQLVNSGNFGAGKLYYFQNTVFAFTSAKSLYSSDLGDTWKTTIGLPTFGSFNKPLPIVALAANDTVIFAAIKYAGIYQSKDAGVSWTPFSTSMPNLRFNDLCLYNNILYLACVDGGIWQYNLIPVTTNTIETVMPIDIWPNPAAQTIHLSWNIHTRERQILKIFDTMGCCVLSQTIDNDNGQAQVQIAGLQPGLYRIVSIASDIYRSGAFIKIR